MCTEKDPLRCHRTLMVCHELSTHEPTRNDLKINHILHDGTLVTHPDLMDQLVRNHRLPPEPKWLNIQKAVQLQAKRVAYRSKTP